jgi:hypothetical protein
MTGWYLSPDFVLEDGERPVVARDLLADAARRVDSKGASRGRRPIGAQGFTRGGAPHTPSEPRNPSIQAESE